MTMPCIHRRIWPSALGCSLLALSGCGGDDPSDPAPTVAPPPKSHTLGGTVSGLNANGLVLDRDGFPMAAWQLGTNIYAGRYH